MKLLYFILFMSFIICNDKDFKFVPENVKEKIKKLQENEPFLGNIIKDYPLQNCAIGFDLHLILNDENLKSSQYILYAYKLLKLYEHNPRINEKLTMENIDDFIKEIEDEPVVFIDIEKILCHFEEFQLNSTLDLYGRIIASFIFIKNIPIDVKIEMIQSSLLLILVKSYSDTFINLYRRTRFIVFRTLLPDYFIRILLMKISLINYSIYNNKKIFIDNLKILKESCISEYQKPESCIDEYKNILDPFARSILRLDCNDEK